ncbi:hypothetical protein MNB_SM-7-1511 [hydrothermal vent metagenome]|uniref:Uncharacterized protein n=1 Tax=hydrothermal vent metagenome TaxID=652676 RepID=A0A1W1B9F9_9ZZZZ
MKKSIKKINIEDYLHTIDIQLKDKTKKDIYMIYIMIFTGLFALSYLLFWDTSFKMFKDKQKSITAIQKKIEDDERFLKFNPPSVIKKLDDRIRKTKLEYIKYKDYNIYLKNRLEKIPFLLYDEQVWGDFINSVDTNAKKFRVKILELSNRYNDTGNSFGHVLDLTLKTKGKYKNVLKFINSLEESDLVVDVHDLNISANDYLESDINISVWGIKY